MLYDEKCVRYDKNTIKEILRRTFEVDDRDF